MVVRLNQYSGKHVNFYEGTHVGVHPKGTTWEKGLTVIVEGRNGKDCVTVEIEEGSNTQIYLMNDQGKTIEKIFV